MNNKNELVFCVFPSLPSFFFFFFFLFSIKFCLFKCVLLPFLKKVASCWLAIHLTVYNNPLLQCGKCVWILEVFSLSWNHKRVVKEREKGGKKEKKEEKKRKKWEKRWIYIYIYVGYIKKSGIHTKLRKRP